MAHILIDGYNLLAVSGDRDRDHFIRKIARFAEVRSHSITVVFDGTKGGTRYGDRYFEGNVEIHFSPITVSADDIIEELLEETPSTSWLVVSSDRRIQSAARRSRGVSVSSEEFHRQMNVALSKTQSKQVRQIDAPWMEGREDETRNQSNFGHRPGKKISKEARKKQRSLKKL